MSTLATLAHAGKKYNVAFLAYLLLGQVESCVKLLTDTKRLPEAAFFARTYNPGAVAAIVEGWKAELAKTSGSAADALSSPKFNPDLFPDFDVALKVEEMFLKNRGVTIPASKYPEAKGDLEIDLIGMVKAAGGGGPTEPKKDDGGEQDKGSDKQGEADVDAEKVAAEKVAGEKVAAEKVAAEKVAAEKAAAEKAAAEKAAAEKAAADKLAAEKLAAEKLAAEKAEAERLAKEKAELEKKLAEEKEDADLADDFAGDW